MLCKLYGFEKGTTYLCEKVGLLHEIVQQHMERAEHSKIVKACIKYSQRDPALWIQALTYFAEQQQQQDNNNVDCQDEIKQVHV